MIEAVEATTELEVRVQEFKAAGAVLDQALKNRDECRSALHKAEVDVAEAGKALSDTRSRLLHEADPEAAERQYW